MLNIIANYLPISLGAVFMYGLISKTVPIRHPKLYFWVLYCWAMGFWVLNYAVFSNIAPTINILSVLGTCVLTFLFAEPQYRFWAVLCRGVYELAFYISSFLLLLIVMPLLTAYGIPEEELLDHGNFGYAVMSFLTNIISCGLIYLFYKGLNMIRLKQKLSPWLLLLLAVPCSQYVLLNIALQWIAEGTYSHSLFPIAAGVVFCVIADVGLMIGVKKIRKSKQLEAHVQLVQAQLDTQVNYYRDLQDSILSVNQIRHDLTNQLQAAYYLLDKGASEEVRRQLDVIRENLHNRIGSCYCANLMIDAVIRDKAALCREKGIRIEITTELPSALPIENAHLCSLFSNILDNAIQGVQESGTTDKYITLHSTVYQSFLTVHCENPAVAPKKTRKKQELLRPHGLGLDILRQLAKRYNGSLTTNWENGIFETVAILQFPE